MPYKIFMGFLGAIFLILPVFASEDMEDLMFGSEIPIDIAFDNEAPIESIKENKTEPITTEASMKTMLPAVIKPEPIKPLPITNDNNDTQKADIIRPNNSLTEANNLTNTIKADTTQPAKNIPLPNIDGTWINKLASSDRTKLLEEEKEVINNLESMIDNARNNDNTNNRSNASVFDISGIMLRMNLRQTDDMMKNRGYRKIMQKYQIPNFIKWRNEEYCSNSGITGYERIQACIVQKAKKDKYQYVQIVKYAKYDTKEEIEVIFTSNFTENKVYKIIYRSMASGIKGNSPKAVYLRNIKVYDFWKNINQKYGKPDDEEAVIWGMGGDKPYLKAKTGWLLLEDPMLNKLDYTRMSREDQRYLNTDLYNF